MDRDESRQTPAAKKIVAKPVPPADKPGKASKSRKSNRPDLKLQIDLPGGTRLGPGKIMLLEMIDTEGSLSKGAKRMRISYRRAWLFVQQVNQSFGEAAVATPEHGHGGGPARLTAFGRELIKRFRDLESATDQLAAGTLNWLAQAASAKSGK